MSRLMLTDEQWSKRKAILLEDKVYNNLEHQKTLEGILYRYKLIACDVIYLNILGCGIPFIVVLFFERKRHIISIGLIN